jgi:hypothetical protein
LKEFFTGAHTALIAAYQRSTGSPDNCAGSVREHAIREALRLTLPHAVRIVDGEIVDSFGNGTGQLDGILVHASGPALAGSEHEPRVVLAEGVLGVMESKSDLTRGDAWERVRDTFTRVIKLRRAYDPLAEPLLRTASPDPSDSRIPFFVVGYKGWARWETVKDHACQLIEIARQECGSHEQVPVISVIQLEPPGFSALSKRGGPPQVPSNLTLPWRAVAVMWATLAHSVQRFQVIPANYRGYVNEDE